MASDQYGDPEFSGLCGLDGQPLLVDQTMSWRRKADILKKALEEIAMDRQHQMILLIAMMNRFGPEVSFSAQEINFAASGKVGVQPRGDSETGEFRLKLVHVQDEPEVRVEAEEEEDA